MANETLRFPLLLVSCWRNVKLAKTKFFSRGGAGHHKVVMLRAQKWLAGRWHTQHTHTHRHTPHHTHTHTHVCRAERPQLSSQEDEACTLAAFTPNPSGRVEQRCGHVYL